MIRFSKTGFTTLRVKLLRIELEWDYKESQVLELVSEAWPGAKPNGAISTDLKKLKVFRNCEKISWETEYLRIKYFKNRGTWIQIFKQLTMNSETLRMGPELIQWPNRESLRKSPVSIFNE